MTLPTVVPDAGDLPVPGYTRLMFRNFGAGEIILILVVVMLLFGATKLPQLARSIGASAKEFRKGVEEGIGDEDDEPDAD